LKLKFHKLILLSFNKGILRLNKIINKRKVK
jgi:hypothetical protein